MSDDSKYSNVNRRDFLRLGATAGLGAAVLSRNSQAQGPKALSDEAQDFVAPPIENVRVGYVGVGHQGTSHVANLLRIPGCQITAIADVLPEHAERAAKMCVEAGQAKPALYTKGPEDYKRLCESDNVDLVYTATPWNWHVPVCVAAMEAGKHAATEVPAAVTLDECWQMVETSERTKRYCIMMENCCYDRVEMMVLNMARQGLFGEVLHAECGYRHDLRTHKLSEEFYVDMWRIKHSFDRNGNLYPTHGLGPVAQVMNVNRGDQFDYLVSMSSKSLGLNLKAEEMYGKDHPLATQDYALGDINITLIRTKNGRTITIYHDTSSPRPYSRINLVQGTKGITRKWPTPSLVHIEGKSPQHQWEELEKYADKYEHPVWTAKGEEARGGGHGGMDYIEDYRLIQCLNEGTQQDLDVYDAAAWSAVAPVSEKSVAQRGASIDFPDFTRGAWKTRPSLGIIEI